MTNVNTQEVESNFYHDIKIIGGAEAFTLLKMGKDAWNHVMDQPKYEMWMVDFTGFRFTDDLDLSGYCFNGIDFSHATFEAKVNFKQATFRDFVCFDCAHFKQETHFIDCVFESITLFYKTTFHKKTTFDRTRFDLIINFIGAKFRNEIRFIDPVLANSLILDEAIFSEHLFIKGNQLEDKRISLKQAQFLENSSASLHGCGKIDLEGADTSKAQLSVFNFDEGTS